MRGLVPLWAVATGVLSAYLLGAVPFAWLAFRFLKGGDIRDHGSGNTGATNLMRFCGKGWAAAVLALDVGKGLLPVVAARALVAGSGQDWWPAAVGAAAVLGHCYPVYLGFRGGKGVATGLGALGALAPLAMLASVGVFIVVTAPTRIVSVGSISAALTGPLWTWLFGYPAAYVVGTAFCGLLIVWRHRANLGRLLRGSESKLGEKS